MKTVLFLTGKILLFLLGSILILILIILVIIRVNSSQEPEPIVDSNGITPPNSIAIINDTIINGAFQRLTIRGHDRSNPVLLRVHGGPGKVEPPQAYRFTGIDLEDKFIVCYWDQRGVGPAFDGTIPESSYTIEQIVKDGLAVTEYLREKFDKQSIYIEGTSTGTIIGSLMVFEKPEYFSAYIGIAQLVDGEKNEKLSYDFVLIEALNREDTVAIKALTKIGSPPYETIEKGNEAVQIARMYADKYSPKSPTTMTTLDIMKLIFLYDGWAMDFKFHLITNGMYSPSTPILWPQFVKINMMEKMIEWPIPIFIIHGEEDHFAEFSLSKMYFDSLNAPRKMFFPVKNTGHSIHSDQPERYREIYLNEILSQ